MAFDTNIGASLKREMELLLRARPSSLLLALSDSNLHWHSRKRGAPAKQRALSPCIISFLCIKSTSAQVCKRVYAVVTVHTKVGKNPLQRSLPLSEPRCYAPMYKVEAVLSFIAKGSEFVWF